MAFDLPCKRCKGGGQGIHRNLCLADRLVALCNAAWANLLVAVSLETCCWPSSDCSPLHEHPGPTCKSRLGSPLANSCAGSAASSIKTSGNKAANVCVDIPVSEGPDAAGQGLTACARPVPRRCHCACAGHRKAVSYVRYLSPGELVSASTDSTLRMWDVQGHRDLRTFSGHMNEKNFVGLSVDGEFTACGSETNEVRGPVMAVWHVFDSWSVSSRKAKMVECLP